MEKGSGGCLAADENVEGGFATVRLRDQFWLVPTAERS
jgi:hypothetical protein